MPLFEYSKWEGFSNTINNSKIACKNSDTMLMIIFPELGK